MRKSLLFLSIVVIGHSCRHPSVSQPVVNWQNLDLEQDGVFGISTEKAYHELLKDKTGAEVVVAVFDSGIDTLQPDLQSVLWKDPSDGSHGRNFVGPETGREDFVPMLVRTAGSAAYGPILDDYRLHVSRLDSFVARLRVSSLVLSGIVAAIGKDHPSWQDLQQYHPRNDKEAGVIRLVLDRMALYPDLDHCRSREIDQLLTLGEYHLGHGLNRAIDAASDTALEAGWSDGAIGNDPLGLVDDPNVSPWHGTDMAGIITAVRNNGTGIDGVADHARIMTLKLTSNIREMRNAELAAAIRYAVDHGAKVFSMSFGKAFSLHRELVDSAVKYAIDRDVLIVHSAGNDGRDIDRSPFFPSPVYADGGLASAWLTVGASGYLDNDSLPAAFSNYGAHTVDVYAPGVQISSTIPNGGVTQWDGTSVATPVVAGLAALIRSYYPRLTAVQVKDLIMQSVVKRKSLADKCVSGGVVNAYHALKLAASAK